MSACPCHFIYTRKVLFCLILFNFVKVHSRSYQLQSRRQNTGETTTEPHCGGGRVGLRRRFKAPISSEARVRIPSSASSFWCNTTHSSSTGRKFPRTFIFFFPVNNRVIIANGALPHHGVGLSQTRVQPPWPNG